MGTRHSVSNLSEQLDFIPEDNRVDNLKHHFNAIKVLGSGVTARVRAVTWLEDQRKVALKQMNRKDKNNEKLFTRECRILQKLIHPNIVQFINCYIDRKYYYILTRLYTGGHLLKQIKKLEHFDESKAARVMKQIVGAVQYMHANEIAHRDLKPENIVFEGGLDALVVIDLGSATELEEGEMYTEWVGSPAFMAPETLRARTSDEVKASDVWSIGVICYQLLTGKYPFWGHNLQQIFREIAQKPLSFPDMDLSDEALAFMKSMLHRGLHHRVSIEQASRDPWLGAQGRQFSRPLSHWSEESDEDDAELKTKEMEIEFKKQASTGQISSSIEEMMESLEESEAKLDDDDDNSSDRVFYEPPSPVPPPTYRQKSSVPFIMALTGAGQLTVNLEDVKEDEEFDDEDVSMYAAEPVPFMQKRRSQWPEELGEDETLRQAFEALDEERNGQVLLKDLQLAMEDFLHRRIAFEEAEVFLDEISPNQDGSIQFEDFAKGMKALAEKSIIEITSLSLETSMTS